MPPDRRTGKVVATFRTPIKLIIKLIIENSRS